MNGLPQLLPRLTQTAPPGFRHPGLKLETKHAPAGKYAGPKVELETYRLSSFSIGRQGACILSQHVYNTLWTGTNGKLRVGSKDY